MADVWILAPEGDAPATRAAARERHGRLFRRLAAARLRAREGDTRVVYDAKGGPRLLEPAARYLSAADRDGWTLVAIAKRPIGVDIEVAHPRDPLPIDLLHADERARLAAISGRERAAAFARLWAAKEAWAKAFGRPIDEALALPSHIAGEQVAIEGAPVAFHHFADRIAALVAAR